MTMTFDPLFDEPFLGGSVDTGSGPPYYLPVSLGGHSYQINVREYKRQTLPALREAIDQSNEPGEHSLNTQGLWTRSQSDWRFGAGQQYFDEEGAIRRRFYSSKGIDPWTEKQASLLNDTEKKLTSANTNLKMLVVNGYLYLADGTNLKFTSDPTPASPSFTTIAAGAAITSITTDGTNVYIATGSTLQRTVIGAGTMSTFGALTPDVVCYANGRLLGSDENRIYEISAAGAVSGLDFSHVNASFDWAGIVPTPHGIYAWGGTADVSEAYFIGINSSTSVLNTPVFAGRLNADETIYDLAYFNKAILIGSSAGFHVAALSDAATSTSAELNYGPLVSVTGGVRAFDPRGQYTWFAWTNYDSTSTGLGRIDLTRFTDDLVPAYASDLMATTQGTVLDVVTFGTRRYFTVSGVGLYGETANKVASGVIRTGKISYGTFVSKVASSIDLKTLALPTGATITIALAGDDGVFADLDQFTVAGAMGPDGLVGIVPGEKNQQIELQFTLTRATDTTIGPTITRWTLFALATPPRTDEIIAPLLIYSEVDNEVGGKVTYQPLVEFQYLKSLETSGQLTRWIEGTTGYDVYVDAVQIMPKKWVDNLSFFEGSILVRLLTTVSHT